MIIFHTDKTEYDENKIIEELKICEEEYHKKHAILIVSEKILDVEIRSSGTGDPPLWICPKTIDLPEYPVSSLIRLASFSTSNIFRLSLRRRYEKNII